MTTTPPHRCAARAAATGCKALGTDASTPHRPGCPFRGSTAGGKRRERNAGFRRRRKVPRAALLASRARRRSRCGTWVVVAGGLWLLLMLLRSLLLLHLMVVRSKGPEAGAGPARLPPPQREKEATWRADPRRVARASRRARAAVLPCALSLTRARLVPVAPPARWDARALSGLRPRPRRADGAGREGRVRAWRDEVW